MASRAGAPAPGADEESAELLRLRSGELTLEEYLELRLDVQVSRLLLDRRLGAADVAALREVLRAHCLTDPLLAQYARQAVGKP